MKNYLEFTRNEIFQKLYLSSSYIFTFSEFVSSVHILKSFFK